ncbi:8-amino-7-oxononanoate synthase [Actinoallomurus iriomotensis]|uniref:8-amino-7-oxononanoate synthase n=1 Tax=Actinoallomurus iriomotensis TaxID=478107 RepID=A0A9W6RZC4_9ACTN|nr:8-amino-7-oxononanoate synthase [Actinoallomurus iriomotensis]
MIRRVDPLERLTAATRERTAAGLRRTLRPRTPAQTLLDLASNDYLGLSRDPRLAEGAIEAVRTWGTGSTGSRLVTGTTELHTALEERLAGFVGTPSALVFSSGYLANLAAVTALRPGLIVSDRGNHASLIDGCRLARCPVVVTPHCDVAAVDAALDGARDAVVVTDAVFSVDGDLAPLRELHAVVRDHGALLLIDEAHALGVVGPGGRGAAYAAGIAGEPEVIITVTLSKSLGSQGGAVLGAPEVIETLVDTARSFVFDTGLAPASAGAAAAALDVLAAEPELATRARDRARRLAASADALGLETTTPAAAVVPVILGDPGRAVRAAEICAEHGVRVGCFRPPSVPQGRACLRLTGRATLEEAELTEVTGALTGVRELIGPYSARNADPTRR